MTKGVNGSGDPTFKKKQKGKGWQSYIPRFKGFNQKCILENLRSKEWNSERHPAYRKVAMEDVQSTTFTLCLRALQLGQKLRPKMP
jgi:esterase/lipase